MLDRRSVIQRESLAFVTVWALFGIELIGRDTKDVVALDADAVNENLRRLGRGHHSFRSALSGRLGRIAHGHILARESGKKEEHPGRNAIHLIRRVLDGSV
jgi:hypothetical protein